MKIGITVKDPKTNKLRLTSTRHRINLEKPVEIPKVIPQKDRSLSQILIQKDTYCLHCSKKVPKDRIFSCSEYCDPYVIWYAEIILLLLKDKGIVVTNKQLLETAGIIVGKQTYFRKRKSSNYKFQREHDKHPLL